jgi:hypothetical protein
VTPGVALRVKEGVVVMPLFEGPMMDGAAGMEPTEKFNAELQGPWPKRFCAATIQA